MRVYYKDALHYSRYTHSNVFTKIGQECEKMELEMLPDIYLYNLLFADDQVVNGQNGEDANYMCKKLVEERNRKNINNGGLNVNYCKTKYMATDPDNLYIDGYLIRKVDRFCYLGSIMELDGSGYKKNNLW